MTSIWPRDDSSTSRDTRLCTIMVFMWTATFACAGAILWSIIRC